MEEIIKAIKEFPKSYFHALSIIGLVYIFTKHLNFFPIPINYQIYVHLGILFCLIISIMDIIQHLGKYIKNERIEKKYKKTLKEELIKLDSYEKDVLCKFYHAKRSTLNLDFRDAVVQGLIYKKILINVTLTGNAYKIDSYLSSLIDPEKDLNLSDFIAREEHNAFYY